MILTEPHKDTFNIYQGATLQRDYQWLVGTIPVDLTSVSEVRCHFRANINDTAPLFVATCTIINAANGEFRIRVQDSVTSAINFEALSRAQGCVPVVALVFDIELTDGTDVVRLVYGTARFHAEVTR